ENDEFLKTIDENMQKIIKEQVKEQVKVQVSKILPKIEQIVNEQLEAEVLTRSSNSPKTSYARNLYKALVEAYESDKIILDTYGETVTLKRRRDDDADKDEEPSAGPDQGSKRRREGKEPESASALTETATRSAGRSTQGTKSRKTSASESATTEEPMHTIFQMEEPLHPEFDTVDTLTPELIAGLTYELLKGSCKSLVELEYHLEKVYKATTDQLDWFNPEGQQYPHNLLKPLPLIPNTEVVVLYHLIISSITTSSIFVEKGGLCQLGIEGKRTWGGRGVIWYCSGVARTMDTTIDQQVAMDEALVPHARRLRIGRRNFHLLSDIKYKESTLQLVYDVTATVHHHSILFKIDIKKHIVNLESFREMLHICPRLPGQSFIEPPFEEEILAFLRFLRHSAAIKRLTDVEHKDTKKSNEMYYPRFTKVIIPNFMSKDPSFPRRNKVHWHYVRDDHMFFMIKLVSRHQNMQQFGAMLPIELTNEDIRNSNAYKEYYAVATGATPPKPKASVQKTRSSSDTTVTLPTAAAGPRLGSNDRGTKLKLATKISLQQTHISQASGSSADEGTGTIPGVPDVPTDESEEEISWKSTNEKGDDNDDDDEGDDGEGDDNDDDDNDEKVNDDAQDDDDQEDEGNDGDDEEEGSDDEQESDEEEFIHPSLNTHAEEEPRDEESFDPISETPKHTDDEGNGEENLGINVAEKKVKMKRTRKTNYTETLISILEGSDRLRDKAKAENDEFLKTIDENIQKIIKEQVKEQVKVQVSKILPKIEQIVNEQLEAEVLTRSSNSPKTSYARNLYKALVEAYESDKIILDTYENTVTLKRRCDDDADKDEEPFAGSDRGSKRRREGKELESASAPQEKATRSTGKSTQGNKTFLATQGSIQPWISDLAKRTESRSSFNELMDTPMDFSAFLMNRLKVYTLTPELLAGPTYELVKGSCKSLVELEFHLEEVYKATIDQLDWINLEGQQYPHNLLKPLPLIPNSQGRHVIPFDQFINNDLEYLRGDASSRKYTTSVTKTKAADYGHIKWIEDLEFARDVYSMRRIIAVTELKIVEWHNYKHLDWITVRRDDDKIYKFKEGDFKRLRIQYIEEMLLLLVQGKLTNLIVEERFAFNVSL
nr:hypothetical protein [Tanacetum cinerariifolium]